MFAIIFSAINTLLAFVFRSVIIKFVLFFGLFFIVHEFTTVLKSLLPTESNLSELFNMVPDTFWYFFNIFQIPLGLKMCLSALVTRFIIRRIPVIG